MMDNKNVDAWKLCTIITFVNVCQLKIKFINYIHITHSAGLQYTVHVYDIHMYMYMHHTQCTWLTIHNTHTINTIL